MTEIKKIDDYIPLRTDERIHLMRTMAKVWACGAVPIDDLSVIEDIREASATATSNVA